MCRRTQTAHPIHPPPWSLFSPSATPDTPTLPAAPPRRRGCAVTLWICCGSPTSCSSSATGRAWTAGTTCRRNTTRRGRRRRGCRRERRQVLWARGRRPTLSTRCLPECAGMFGCRRPGREGASTRDVDHKQPWCPLACVEGCACQPNDTQSTALCFCSLFASTCLHARCTREWQDCVLSGAGCVR